MDASRGQVYVRIWHASNVLQEAFQDAPIYGYAGKHQQQHAV